MTFSARVAHLVKRLTGSDRLTLLVYQASAWPRLLWLRVELWAFEVFGDEYPNAVRWLLFCVLLAIVGLLAGGGR